MVKIRKTPGVYVEEVSNLAPSVASVATAIPAFLGYTEKGTAYEPKAIRSYLEYVAEFGGAPEIEYVPKAEGTTVGTLNNGKFVMANAVRMYFDNGGGKCYIVSVGSYKSTTSKEHFIGNAGQNITGGLPAIEAVDEVTLLACPDAALIFTNPTDLGDIQKKMLAQCAKTMDRFAILDAVKGTGSDNFTTFKTNVGNDNLSYGAAYYPNLVHSYDADIKPASIANYLMDNNKDLATAVKEMPEKLEAVKTAEAAKAAGKKFEEVKIDQAQKDLYDFYTKLTSTDELDLKAAKANTLYKDALAALQDMASEITPSGAVLGAIVSTDANFGVWKAPANISLAAVKDVKEALSSADQEDLNVDADTGKNINCIRKFFGKGIIVWGARTLDGFSDEWRYIPVRRLFNYIEESVQKSTMWAVFEPNDENTWVKIKCQIANFLTNIWRQGALVGATPEDAFFVNVGVPTTMTADDVKNGRMIVEVGIAASRPAEFITLVFSHKMEQ